MKLKNESLVNVTTYLYMWSSRKIKKIFPVYDEP